MDSHLTKAPVNRIIPFSAVDGPGNRSAVFLQGCNFNCVYCHNPETRNMCNNCGKCADVCPAGALTVENGIVKYNQSICCMCDACINTCEFGASPRIRMMDAGEVLDEIRDNLPFIRGITVSGGECTLYPKFLTELFTRCKKINLGTLIDSNGSIDLSKSSKLLEVTDGIMLDIKAYDASEHRDIIGTDNKQVLESAKYLAGIGKLYEVRTVIVPELFDYEKTVIETAELLSPYLKVKDIRYKLITYRKYGVRKEYAGYSSPVKAELEYLSGLIKHEGFTNVTIV